MTPATLLIPRLPVSWSPSVEHGTGPRACQGYDTAEVIVQALKAVNGNTQDKDKLVAILSIGTLLRVPATSRTSRT